MGAVVGWTRVGPKSGTPSRSTVTVAVGAPLASVRLTTVDPVALASRTVAVAEPRSSRKM